MLPILFKRTAILMASLYFSGCAPAMTTAVSGRYDEVIISTEPSNVQIYDKGGNLLARSPAKLTLARMSQPTLYLSKAGFRDTTITLKGRFNRLIPLSIVPAPTVGHELPRITRWKKLWEMVSHRLFDESSLVPSSRLFSRWSVGSQGAGRRADEKRKSE